MKTTAKIVVPSAEHWLRFDSAAAGPIGSGERTGPGAGGPVGAMHDALNARLTATEYERWLLPPEPRDAMESTVHALSLAAGVLALTGGAALMWLVL